MCVAVASVLPHMDYPFWVICIRVVLLLIIGTALSVFLAGMAANQCNQRLLSLLHIELQPEKFVAAYADVPGRAAGRSAARVITASYLADGYCAMGLPQKAQETLVWDCKVSSPRKHLALQGLLLHNRCRYCLHAEDALGALSAAHELQEVVSRLEQENASLADNLNKDLKLYRIWADVLNGTNDDDEYPQEMLKQFPAKIAMLELNWILARHYLNKCQRDKAKPYLSCIPENGGNLALVAKALQATAECGL